MNKIKFVNYTLVCDFLIVWKSRCLPSIGQPENNPASQPTSPSSFKPDFSFLSSSFPLTHMTPLIIGRWMKKIKFVNDTLVRGVLNCLEVYLSTSIQRPTSQPSSPLSFKPDLSFLSFSFPLTHVTPLSFPLTHMTPSTKEYNNKYKYFLDNLPPYTVPESSIW